MGEIFRAGNLRSQLYGNLVGLTTPIYSEGFQQLHNEFFDCVSPCAGIALDRPIAIATSQPPEMGAG